jgi:hypothetical protein
MVEDLIDMIANDGYRSAAGGIYSTRVYEFANAIEAEATAPLLGRLTALESERDALLAAAGKEAVTKLQVMYGPMPESNGKTNWTAILHKGDLAEGHTIDRSEYPDRVRYAADCVRYLIGELQDRPWILDYDADKHSGYVAPTAAPEKGDGRDAWISVVERLPKCSRTKGSMSVEVLVWPLTESGEATAFYGRRVTDTPAFYRYGAVINHVTHWQPLPAPPAALSQKANDGLSLRAQHEDACIEANKNAQDAARYRHLRECNSGSLVIVQIIGTGEDDQIVLTEEHADEAIDAALSQQNAGE